tara:strand:- start:4018 stop:4461 length:444 start_codon:yes stop_codon:yes gene_type:complete
MSSYTEARAPYEETIIKKNNTDNSFNLENFGLVEFINQPGNFGIVFAVLRENPEVCLIAKSEKLENSPVPEHGEELEEGTITVDGKFASIVSVHSSFLRFHHYSKWEELFIEHSELSVSMKAAYNIPTEDFPCGFACPKFNYKQEKT